MKKYREFLGSFGKPCTQLAIAGVFIVQTGIAHAQANIGRFQIVSVSATPNMRSVFF